MDSRGQHAVAPAAAPMVNLCDRAYVGTTPPDLSFYGNLWWDTVSAKLFIWSGTEWVIVANTP